MGAFDDLLSKGAPEPEVSIFLPGRVGTVDKGGDASPAAAAPAGRPSDSQTSGAAPEPEPQLPEGSDPDDPDNAEDDAADAAAAAAAAREMFGAEAAQAAEAELAPDDDPEEATTEVSDVEGDQAEDEEGMPPVIPRKGGGLSFEGESAYLKQFPRVFIDQMRRILEVQVSEEFARDISQVSIVAAFVSAHMDTALTVDDVTAHAVKAFRAVDPRTDAIDRRTTLLLEQQSKSDGKLKAILARLGEVAETAAVLEMGQAYALSERTAQLETSGTLPETIDVAQKRVVAARDNIRRRVKAQRQDERISDGRPIR